VAEPADFPPSLSDRYEKIRPLGQGGMASVYLARDLKHGRNVAVKIMRPDLAMSVARPRFLREIQIATTLRHPNIVPLFDSGEADESLYYVMPYEAGHSLRERLSREPRLPLDDALWILRDVCEALAHAHRQGIVHRDIKPDNILLSGGRATVIDFGVARAISAAADTMATTSVGLFLGTPAYMAPDRPSPVPDPRLDVYAFGVMAFELLAGQRPFRTGLELNHHSSIRALRGCLDRLRPDLPEWLSEVVARCMAPTPEERYGDATEIGKALLTPRTGGVPGTGSGWYPRLLQTLRRIMRM
jgi:serine/threonine-protein kinase